METEEPNSPGLRAQPAFERPQPHRLLATVRFMAQETDRVIIGYHAQERMIERGILADDLYEVLRLGELKGRIVPGGSDNEWKCKIAGRPRGSRQLGVVTIVKMDEYLFIKTVEWEDR